MPLIRHHVFNRVGWIILSEFGNKAGGTVCLELMVNGEKRSIQIAGALHVPSGRKNLVSDPHLTRLGYHITRDNDTPGWIIGNENGHALAHFHLQEAHLYEIHNGNFVQSEDAMFLQTIKKVPHNIWHARFGHPSIARMRHESIEPLKEICEICGISKSKFLPHGRALPFDPVELVAGDYMLVQNANLSQKNVGYFLPMDIATGCLPGVPASSRFALALTWRGGYDLEGM